MFLGLVIHFTKFTTLVICIYTIIKKHELIVLKTKYLQHN